MLHSLINLSHYLPPSAQSPVFYSWKKKCLVTFSSYIKFTTGSLFSTLIKAQTIECHIKGILILPPNASFLLLTTPLTLWESYFHGTCSISLNTHILMWHYASYVPKINRWQNVLIIACGTQSHLENKPYSMPRALWESVSNS